MTVRHRLQDLERLAVQAGYDSYRSMLFDLYITKRMGVEAISKRLFITTYRVRKHLKRFDIPKKQQLWRQEIPLSPELEQEILRDGVPAVAARLGTSAEILHRKLRERYGEK